MRVDDEQSALLATMADKVQAIAMGQEQPDLFIRMGDREGLFSSPYRENRG